MKLPDDDELYEVDGTYLGPPGRYIGVMRYRAIFAFIILAPVSMVIMRRLHLPITLLTVGLWLIGSIYLAGVIADRISRDVPALALLKMVWNDLSAPRDRQAKRAQAATVGSTFQRATSESPRWRRVLERRSQRHSQIRQHGHVGGIADVSTAPPQP